MRMLGWCCAGLAALLVLFTLAVALSGEDGDLRGAVDGALGEAVMSELPPPRGERLLLLSEPFAVSVDLCAPDHRLASSYRFSRGFLSFELGVLNQPLPQAFHFLLSDWKGELQLVDGWSTTFVDVRVMRYAGLLSSSTWDESMAAMRQAGAEALADAFGLSIERASVERELAVLVAGPRFVELTRPSEGQPTTRMAVSGDGVLEVSGLPREALAQQLRKLLDVQDVRLPDDDGSPCSVSLSWEAGNTEALLAALEQQFDLVLTTEPGEVEQYRITGPEGPGGG
ncbi:MAG: hypothetical protein DRQ55_03685 [Planctomycetota bacterium]|nr:MAG: hypothetical protein DRQ55_03685 [Planctomycetota bacterium]